MTFSAAQTTRHLREFQRRTVEHVVGRLYDPQEPAFRFLVADEVGLGKTMVARGVIAHAIERLRGKADRIDVVYICSNAAIARQNIRRLNPLPREEDDDSESKEPAAAERLTLLAKTWTDRQAERPGLNFISITPGTSLDLASRSGTVQERALLLKMLRRKQKYHSTAIWNLLQGPARWQGWQVAVDNVGDFHDGIARAFLRKLRDDTDLVKELDAQCAKFVRWRPDWPSEYTEGRYRLIGKLRYKLASAALEFLEPDLVILDEFQRFKDLLTGESEAAELARNLFDYADRNGNKARTLLLSATPYRMPLQDPDEKGDHYRDLITTLSFLYEDLAKLQAVEGALLRYRDALRGYVPNDTAALDRARREVQARLHAVMVRTERVGKTSALDAMVQDHADELGLHEDDLAQGVLLDRIGRHLKAGRTLDYWKSAAFPLSFMSEYDLTRKLRQALTRPDPELAVELEKWRRQQPRRHKIATFTEIVPTNGRMRRLIKETVGAGQAEVLWLPPSLPYYALGKAWSTLGRTTKTLIFSEWDMVPNSIAGLLSYEAERKIRDRAATFEYRKLKYGEVGELRGALRGLRMDGTRPAEMMQFCLLYPCATLAGQIDPLTMKADTVEAARQQAAGIAHALIGALSPNTGSGPSDPAWAWASLSRLDGVSAGSAPSAWLDGKKRWLHGDSAGSEVISLAERRHLDALAAGRVGNDSLGGLPDDLAEILTDIALGSPAVCSLRALHRLAPELDWGDTRLQHGAGKIANAFRSLFNRSEATLLLAGSDEQVPYWRRVLRYCAEGNLQAVLDEYAHQLVESLGVVTAAPEKKIEAIAEEIAAAIGIRGTNVQVHQIKARNEGFYEDTHLLRCRFALRLGEMAEGREGANRPEQVRQAFNSPFWPFVLASTSVGQEGLDFHPYCHAVWHWNLPSNPVDMEQREGRVHRYKGHAVRRNIALAYGAQVLGDAQDPWAHMFALARRDNEQRSELIPYWVFEYPGGASVERHVPLLPFSRDIGRYEWLKRNLALYRLAFGQPRQADLVAWLDKRLAGIDVDAIAQLQIDLSPPAG